MAHRSRPAPDVFGKQGKQALAAHGAAMSQAVQRGVMAGVASTAMHQGRVVYRRAFGYADLESRTRFSHDTIGRIYCASKPFVGIVAVGLADEGRLDLQAPVAKYIPSLGRLRVQPPGGLQAPVPARGLRVEHLLTHTAGLSYGADFNFPPTEVQARYRDVVEGVERGRIRSLAGFVDALAAIPLCFQPGERYEYSYCTDVLGRVLEVVCGKSLADVLQERLFEPLGMSDTSFGVPSGQQHRLAALYGNATTWGHLYGDDQGAVPVASKPGLVRIDGRRPEDSAWVEKRVNVLSGGGLVGHNRGGLLSTARDTEAFVQMLLAHGRTPNGTQFIRRKTLARMERNRLVGRWRKPGTKWCLLGDMLKDGAFQQGGAAGNYWLVDRKRDIGIVVFMQQVDGEDWQNLGFDPAIADLDKIMRNLVDASPAPMPPSKKRHPLPAASSPAPPKRARSPAPPKRARARVSGDGLELS